MISVHRYLYFVRSLITPTPFFIVFLLPMPTPQLMTTFNFLDLGGIPDDSSLKAQWHNGALLNSTLSPTFLTPGSTLHFPPFSTFFTMGGIFSEGLTDVSILLDGTLSFSEDVKSWPRNKKGRVLECLEFKGVHNFTLASTLGGGKPGKMGTLKGMGQNWWWWPFLGYHKFEEDRPRLLHIDRGTDILIKDILFLDSPYWTTELHGVERLEIDGCGISARRSNSDGHSMMDISAFNTDGFDISGHDVYVHDCNCYAQDDCFTVKDNYDGVSENMLFENNNASGMAMVLGSIGGTHVRNITFRNFVVHNSFKGIYTKFRGGSGKMTDITFENIIMDSIEQYPIWIGPAQQADDP
jgi:polygalacturonase